MLLLSRSTEQSLSERNSLLARGAGDVPSDIRDVQMIKWRLVLAFPSALPQAAFVTDSLSENL